MIKKIEHKEQQQYLCHAMNQGYIGMGSLLNSIPSIFII